MGTKRVSKVTLTKKVSKVLTSIKNGSIIRVSKVMNVKINTHGGSEKWYMDTVEFQQNNNQ